MIINSALKGSLFLFGESMSFFPAVFLKFRSLKTQSRTIPVNCICLVEGEVNDFMHKKEKQLIINKIRAAASHRWVCGPFLSIYCTPAWRTLLPDNQEVLCLKGCTTSNGFWRTSRAGPSETTTHRHVFLITKANSAMYVGFELYKVLVLCLYCVLYYPHGDKRGGVLRCGT